MDLTGINGWFTRADIELAEGITLERDNYDGITLRCKGDREYLNEELADDENGEVVVVRVPHDIIISNDTILDAAADDPVLQQWLSYNKCTGVSLLHRGLLYFWLVKQGQCLWSDYFEMLPKQINLPYGYSIEGMQRLDISSVSIHHAAMSKRLEIEKEYERFIKSGVAGSHKITLGNWLLPHKWISSRGLAHPVTGEVCLVPAIDLCNHSSKNSNVRYDTTADGTFELRVLPGATISRSDLLLDYGNRSTGEFVFNYGFVPEDRSDKDFDEIFRVFDPGDEDVKNALLQGGDNVVSEATYELLLSFFEDEIPQVLRIVRLPIEDEPDEKKRYRFHNNFIMTLACFDKLDVRQEEEENDVELFLGSEQIHPKLAFQQILTHEVQDVVEDAKRLVAKLCKLYYGQVSNISNPDPSIVKLAEAEASIYLQYMALNGKS